MIFQLIINKKYFKCYWKIYWNYFTLHLFIWHLCFAFTISDFYYEYNQANFWQGFCIAWDWISEWIDGRLYKHIWEVRFQDISQYNLYQDPLLYISMSGII